MVNLALRYVPAEVQRLRNKREGITMTRIKRYFKLDIVGICIVTYSMIIAGATFLYQSQLTERIVAVSYFALIILYLLLRLVFVKYEFSFASVLGVIILPMVVFALGARTQFIDGIGVILPVCLGILMGVLTFVRRGGDIRNYKIAIAAVSVFWILSFISAVDFVEVAFDSRDIKTVDVEIQEKAYSVSGRIIDEYSFYVYGDFEGQQSVPVNVTYEQYQKLKIGDKIKIYVGEGLFSRRYYYYERNPVPSSKIHFSIIDDGDDSFLNYLENEKLTYEVEK